MIGMGIQIQKGIGTQNNNTDKKNIIIRIRIARRDGSLPRKELVLLFSVFVLV